MVRRNRARTQDRQDAHAEVRQQLVVLQLLKLRVVERQEMYLNSSPRRNCQTQGTAIDENALAGL